MSSAWGQTGSSRMMAKTLCLILYPSSSGRLTPHRPLGNRILFMTQEMVACTYKSSNMRALNILLDKGLGQQLHGQGLSVQAKGLLSSPGDKLGFSQFPDSVVRLGVNRLRHASFSSDPGAGQPVPHPGCQGLSTHRSLHVWPEAAGCSPGHCTPASLPS